MFCYEVFRFLLTLKCWKIRTKTFLWYPLMFLVARALFKFVSLRAWIVVFFVPNSNVECLDSVHLQYTSQFVVLCSCFLFYKEAHTKHSKLLNGNLSLLPVLEIPSPIKIRNRASKLCFCNSKYFRKKSYETTCFTKFRDSVDWL